MKDLCKRCGQCCHIVGTDERGKAIPTDIPCPFLGEGECTIYEKRLGVDIGHGNHCSMNKYRPFDYEDCPYNQGKPLVKDKLLISRIDRIINSCV